MNDEELMLSYKNGSEEAFNELYRRYSGSVYSYIKKRLRDSESADFYQKIWRHLHEKRQLYNGQPFAPWFFVMMRHLLIDEYRDLGRRRESQIVLREHKEEKSEDVSDLEELLNTLAPETADLVRKYYLEGISYEELESETGLSQMSLRKRLSRAIGGLKNKVRGF